MDRADRGLGIAAIAVVLVGTAVALTIGLAAGMDRVALILFGFILGAGVLVLAAVGRMRGGSITPGHCALCEGLISPNSPYCKHCGEPVL